MDLRWTIEANTTCIPVDPQIRSNPLETESQNQTIGRDRIETWASVYRDGSKGITFFHMYVQRRAEGVDTRLTPAATPISTVDFLGR